MSKADLFSLSEFGSICIVFTLACIMLLPAHAQSGGLKVIVSNERESGEVCVSSVSETLQCKDVNVGEDEEFQFAPNAVPVDAEFQVCLDEEFCVTRSNSPENEPEYVTLLASDLEEAQPSGADLEEAQPSGADLEEAQPSGATPQEDIMDSNGVSGLVISIVLIAIVVAIGIGIKRLFRKKIQEERHGFPDIVKERVWKKQNYRCAHCNRLLNVVDWDHKNGKRNDNSESNCQALCPNCHAIKTRSRH